jgi:hypothetical protein
MKTKHNKKIKKKRNLQCNQIHQRLKTNQTTKIKYINQIHQLKSNSQNQIHQSNTSTKRKNE